MAEDPLDLLDLPPSAQAVLFAPPGTLNDINNDDVDSSTISADQSGWSLIQQAVRKVLTPNKLKNVNRFMGVLLRKDDPYQPGDSSYTKRDTVNMATNSMKGSNKYKLPTYRIHVPELHFMLPTPNSVRCPEPSDNRIIDCYPVVQAVDRFTAKSPVAPGDLVWVELSNKGAISGLTYMGPVDSEGMIRPKATGASPLPQGKCLDDCIKKYPNRGARGDSISNFGNLSKPNTGLPPLISGEGISESRIICAPIHKKWLCDRFEQLQSGGSYRGLVWLGVCKNNGPEDNLNMLTDEGKWLPNDENGAPRGKPGRSTVIYMPLGADPTSELEIIYWFHGGLGFKNGIKEWQDIWSSSLKGMTKGKKALGNQRRNFVFVAPEMLWSQQGSDSQGVPRRQTQITSGSVRSAEATTYHDRQWNAWGFNGTSVTEQEHKIPYSYKSLPSPLPHAVAGNMVALHDEVLGILEDHFNLTDRNNVKHLTLVAEQKGGAAISNLARMGVLKDLNPTKIVLAHSDYSSVGPLYWYTLGTEQNPGGLWRGLPYTGSPNKGEQVPGVQNRFHDNDLYEIIQNVDQNNPPQIEVHISWAPNQTKLPWRAFGSFLGATIDAGTDNEGSSFATGVQKLKNFYMNKQVLPTVNRFYHKGQGGGIPASSLMPLSPNLEQHPLASAYNKGNKFILTKKSSAIRLPGSFSNIVYKGWPRANIKGAIGWLPVDSPAGINIIKEVTLAKEENTLLGDPNISNDIKEVFRDFDGKVILYNSDFVGPSKTVAILSAPGTYPRPSNYELIYYLHGDIGLKGAARTYTHALGNQIKDMINQERNVIVVLMDIDPYPFSALSNLWAEGTASTFNDFHEEVLDKLKILEQFNSTGEMPVPAGSPKFFTIKAHGGGSRMLDNAMKNLDDKYIGPNGGLTRIDLLDANWGMEWSILKRIKSEPKWKSKVTLGTNFEIQAWAGPKTFGPQKISIKDKIEQLFNMTGVWAQAVDTSYNAMPHTYFSAKSELLSNTGTPLLPLTMSEPSYLNLVFDKYGQAYSNGERRPGYDLKIAKGILKNHIPSTEQVGQTAECETDCFQTHSTTKNTPTASPIIEQDCKKNPLGLIEYKTSQYSSVIVHPIRANFTWGTKEMGKYLKGLDDPLWLKTKLNNNPAPTGWVIKDMSPKTANGIDKVRGHRSHREGIDVNIVLPQNDVSTPTLKRITSSELDIDKTLVFMILSKLHGAKIIFLDKKFSRHIEDRAMFIANDGPGILKTDSAFKLFFKKHLFGKPQFVKELMSLLHHKRGHEDHFQVRITRKWASHETKDYPRWALQRLKKLGCNYQGIATA